MNEILPSENQVEHPDEQNGSVALSRRSFVAAVGALAYLPAVAGGFVLPTWADEAFAAENSSSGSTASGSADAKIIIAKKNEFGILVADMTDDKKKPVPNAKVKLITYDKKEVSGVSDSKGKVLLDISSLDKPRKDEDGFESYSFFAQLEVSAEGFRNYRTGRIYVMGGRGIMAPTRKINDEPVYPQQVTFDDWDVLYTGNSFAVTVGNDVKHTFKIELVTNVTKPMWIRIMPEGSGKDLAAKQVQPKNGIAQVEFTDYFLLNKHKSALPIGKKIELVVDFGIHQRSTILAMTTQAAPDKATAPGSAKVTLNPFDPNGLKPSITMPKWVPLLGGKVVNVWTPELPVNFWFDPYGFVKFVARTGELGYKYKDKDGKTKEDEWKYHPRKSSEDQWTEANNERKALLQKVGKAIREKGGLLRSVSYTSTINATAMLQIAAAGKWRDDEALWRLGVSLQAVLAFNVSYSQQFMVGPIPAIFEFSFLSSITVGVSGAVATTDLTDISKYSWDYGNAGVSATVVLAPSLSFGIGLKGLLSASIQGQLSFSFCVAVRAIPHDAAKNLKNPHLVMGLVAQINVVVQAFIFSKTFNMWEVGDPTWFDNWNGKFPGGNAERLSTQAVGDGNEPQLTDFDDMQIVKDEWLAEVAEFSSERGYPAQTMSTQSKEAAGSPANSVAYTAVEKEGRTIDGDTYRYTVYTPGNPSRTITGGDSPGLMVGSAPDLATQGLQAQDLPAEAEYGASGSHDYQAFVEERQSKRVKGVASLSGLVPANDVCVAKGVFSDPRIKAIHIGDKVHVFRISTVTVGGQSRTRIVGQALGSSGNVIGDMKVYDFDPIPLGDFISIFTNQRPNRNDMYDYDFDVAFTPMGTVTLDPSAGIAGLFNKTLGVLTFFVISGKRNNGTGTSFGEAACDQTFSLVRYVVYENGNVTLAGATAATAKNMDFDAAGGGAEYPFHSFSCPQIIPLGKDDSAGSAGWMFTYLDRAGKSAADAVSAEAGKARVGLGVGFFDSAGRVTPIKTNDLVSKKRPIQDSSTYEMTCSGSFAPGENGTAWHLVMMRGRNEVVYYLLNTVTIPSAFGGGGAVKDVHAVEAPKSNGSEPMRLVEWPKNPGMFLTSHGGKLQKVTVNLGGTPSFKFEGCGLTNFNVNSFGVDPTGSVIFWPACGEDNAGYSYDGEGNGKKRNWSEVHQVMGSRLRNGTFSDPFVYGEVNHDMHMMQVLDYLNANSLTLLSIDMKDAQKGHADLWFTSIPLIKCANVVGCEAASQFAYPGEKALFYLTVRNDGNTYLAGFTARLAEHGKNSVSSSKLVFSKATLCESGYNPSDGGSLKNVEPDYALPPGKTSVYQVEIEIPRDWKDETKVTVSAAEAIVAGPGSVKAQGGLSIQAAGDAGDDEVEEYIVGTGEYGTKDYSEHNDEDDTGVAPFDLLHVWGQDTYDDDAEEEYYDAPFDEDTDDDDEKSADKSKKTAAQTKPAPSNTVPQGGDIINPFGLAAAAIAAAGVGLAAYSKRRSDLEDE